MDDTEFWLGRPKRPSELRDNSPVPDPACRHAAVQITDTFAGVCEIFRDRTKPTVGFMAQLLYRGKCRDCTSDVTKVIPLLRRGRFAKREAAYEAAMTELNKLRT